MTDKIQENLNLVLKDATAWKKVLKDATAWPASISGTLSGHALSPLRPLLTIRRSPQLAE